MREGKDTGEKWTLRTVRGLACFFFKTTSSCATCICALAVDLGLSIPAVSPWPNDNAATCDWPRVTPSHACATRQVRSARAPVKRVAKLRVAVEHGHTNFPMRGQEAMEGSSVSQTVRERLIRAQVIYFETETHYRMDAGGRC